MTIDVSSNQGAIDWQKVANSGEVDGVILRATTKNGNLDVRTMENFNGVFRHLPDVKEISAYKFSYARTFEDASIEAFKLLQTLKDASILKYLDRVYLDLEGFSGRDYTTAESSAVIIAYLQTFDHFDIADKFALYFNYNYLKNIIDPMWRTIPIWLARYNSVMGDVFGANVILWQYTSTGKIDGISTNVDKSVTIK